MTTNVPASFQQPIQQGYQQPLLAPTGPVVVNPAWPTRAQSTEAQPLVASAPAGSAAPVRMAPPLVEPSNDEPPPPLAPPQESAIPLMPAKPADAKPASGERPSGASMNRASFKPIVATGAAENGSQAAHLVAALFGDNVLSSPPRMTVRLVDCLQTVAPARRLEAIELYWTARKSAAECQLLAEEKQWVDSLKPTLAAQNPPSPTGMVTFRSARSGDRSTQLAGCRGRQPRRRFSACHHRRAKVRNHSATINLDSLRGSLSPLGHIRQSPGCAASAGR